MGTFWNEFKALVSGGVAGDCDALAFSDAIPGIQI
jgi:hypothetical protein